MTVLQADGPASPPLLPWQQRQWAGLMDRHRSGRMPHALLLTGERGLGKRQFAQQLSQAVLCESPAASGAACGTCRSCRLFVAGSHPDHLLVTLEEDSKVIKIGQIRAAIARLGLKSQLSGYRTAIIVPAERMNTEAANSLLKTLEEPGERTLLLLISEQPGVLPATIRSRCQKLVFARPAGKDALDWLRGQAPGGGDPELALSLADGGPLTALEWLSGDGLARRSAFAKDFLAVAGGSSDALAVAGRWEKGQVGQCVQWLQGWVMDMIRLKVAAAPPALSGPDLAQQLHAIAGRLDLHTLYAHLDRLREAGRLVNTQVSGQSLLEAVLVPWMDLKRRSV